MTLGTFTPKTGLGATLAASSQTIALQITEINEAPITRDNLNSSYLGTTGFETLEPGDLKKPPKFTVTAWWDASKPIPTFGASETFTVTLPKTTGGTTAANLAATGFVTSALALPAIKLGSLMMQKFEVQCDGKTGPTLTVEA